ncbi:MAG: NADH-quinone oxidoreductase subunit J [Deltaproteobacteria bacterium]|nr:NADH-quinone oxidoreductase subunit J [Deltaproteobacteria bacterium]
MTTLADYFPPTYLAQAAFWFTIGVTLVGALLAVIPKNIVHNVMGLALSMFGVTGLYLYLGSQFVAMMQLLIYVGAICVTYIFAIMLSPPLMEVPPKRQKAKMTLALLVSVVTFASLTLMILSFQWQPLKALSRDWSIKQVGQVLLTRYFLVFELISLLLAIAIIGSIMIAGLGRSRE